jgi:cellulose synthase/poly-beta-1,6-N-acetylglucosamine synthase-like glycosyltransferase
VTSATHSADAENSGIGPSDAENSGAEIAGDTAWPSVAVLVPTHDRPELVRRALRAIAGQDYPGQLEIVVVFDRSDPDESLAQEFAPVLLRVMRNSREPGLCGSRNTAILATEAELVAFCDDDDEWLPGKLRAQVAALVAEPQAEFASTSILVDYDGTESPRLAGRDRVRYPELLRSRMAMLHSSTFLARRASLLDGIGLLDESIPGSMCEDWDILLRAARRQPIVHVDRPLVRVLWGRTSFFSQRWETKLAAHTWMLEHHPDILTSRVGAARVYGQMAFSQAALGRRRLALSTAARSLRTHWKEPRGVLAVAVAAGVPSSSILRWLHKRGRGV